MRIAWGLVVLVVVCVGAKLLAPEARAANAPVTVAFTEVGAHTFTVPAGITSIHVVAVGAPGGSLGTSKGGRGAVATADMAVTPGQTLGVYVGGEGKQGKYETTQGAFNGGGISEEEGVAGGGGASDVRTGGPGDLMTRLVVAGGGGGTGSLSDGADAGQTAATSPGKCSGGEAGTASGGGKGGAVLAFYEGTAPGKPGTLGSGGASGLAGGGGGGLYGGGGGGGGVNEGHAGDSDGCGGGGGSSGFGLGTSTTSVTVSESRTPSVTISYVPASTSGTPTKPGGPGSPDSPAAKARLSLTAVQHGKEVTGAVQIPANRSTLKAKLLWQKTKKKKLVFGTLNEGALKKGLHSFTVKLNGSGKAKLAALRKLKLTLAVAVIPPQGAVAKAAKKVTLKP